MQSCSLLLPFGLLCLLQRYLLLPKLLMLLMQSGTMLLQSL